MTGIMCGMFASTGVTNNFTVTVGTDSSTGVTYYGYGTTSPVYGNIAPKPAKVAIFSGATMNDIWWLADYFSGYTQVAFIVTGNQTSTSWTSVNIGGNTYTKASLSSSAYYSGSNTTSFVWDYPAVNPFGTTVGASVSVTFA